MKPWFVLPLVLALAVPAAFAADAPEPPSPHQMPSNHGMRPAPIPMPKGPVVFPTVELLRKSMLASDSILVTRVEMQEHSLPDSAGQMHTTVVPKRVALNNVKSPWMKRFVANFLPEGTVLDSSMCPPPTGTAGLPRPWLLSAIWINADGRGQAYVNLLNGCAFLGVLGGKPANFGVSAHTDSLLALFQQALYADTALAHVRAAALPDTSHATPVAIAPDTPPEPLTKVAPVYPDSARAAGVEGTVIVKALIGSDGRVMHAEIETGVPGLDAAALTAVRQWRFKPGTENGRPRAMSVGIPVSFHLTPAETGKKKP